MHPFEEIYHAAWRHPGVCWAANAGLLAAVLLSTRRSPAWLKGWTAGFALCIALDAWFTGALSPLETTHPLYTQVSILFVILGDWRWFVLLLLPAISSGARGAWKWWPASLGLALVVPICQALLIKLFPALFANARNTFLAYELIFAALTAGFLARSRLLLHGEPESLIRWFQRVSLFVLGYYFLWASADVLILSGFMWGHLLRIVPDTLYYAGFLWFVWLSCPVELRISDA
ncbi:MAG: hypothetical protein GMKNLPBB_02794 [Myxococcota bacterium]|nr:hypothetical protein [Myxococcota bacterium]